jgi:hypothetical protein
LPLTQPAAPASNWVVRGAVAKDADDGKVDELLQKLHPLRADKYLPSPPPETKTVARYILKITTVAAGGATVVHELQVTDRGETEPLIGRSGTLTFELSHTLAQNLTADFGAKAAAPPVSIEGAVKP